MINSILFDLDGTFADTAPDLGAALNHVRQQRKLPPLPLQTIRPQASHGAAGLLKLGFGIEQDEPEFAELRTSFLEYYADHICVYTTLFENMAELVDALERKGLPWGIVTNKPHCYTVPLMQALGYAERAACLISGDSCERAKPYPDTLFKACEMMGIAPQSCLYVGDDLRDMRAAQAANMSGIIALYGYIDGHAATAGWNAAGEINNPLELLNYI